MNLPITPRDYQTSIFNTAKNSNTLVVLPTGLGKTLIAIMLAIERKKLYPLSRVLFLAPTRPLVEQHFQTFKSILPELFAQLEIFTGSVPAEKRKKMTRVRVGVRSFRRSDEGPERRTPVAVSKRRGRNVLFRVCLVKHKSFPFCPASKYFFLNPRLKVGSRGKKESEPHHRVAVYPKKI